MKTRRVSVSDLLAFSPIRDSLTAEQIRDHISFDAETDTIEVEKSHAERIAFAKACQQFSAALGVPFQEATDRLNAALKSACQSWERLAERMRRDD